MRTLTNQNIPFKMIQGDASHLRTVFSSIPDSARFLFPLPDGLDLVADISMLKKSDLLLTKVGVSALAGLALLSILLPANLVGEAVGQS